MKKLISILLLSLSFTSLKAADVCYYSDWEALQDFYTSTNGDNWTDTTGWTYIKNAVGNGINNALTCPAVEPYGITTIISDNFTLNGVSIELRSVSVIELFNNNLSGTLPTSIGDLSQCSLLELSYNSLTGNIPTELGSCSNLIRIYMETNQLSGVIPTSLGDLNALESLSLETNNLTGSIPTSLGNLNSLNTLWLEYNELSGPIPVELGNLSALVSLRLNSNLLTGSIPPSLGDLSVLVYLSLANNQLTGTIPESFGCVEVASGNSLTGSTIGGLLQLTSLYLYGNDLEGCYASSLTSLCTRLTSNFSQISNGNPKLLSTFSDFCSTGKGTCKNCYGDLNLVSTADDYDRGKGYFYAGGPKGPNFQIVASNKLTSNTNITYNSTKTILLEPGFKVDNGAVFKAVIDGGCL